MSTLMNPSPNKNTPAVSADSLRYALSLATFARHRRQELGLTIERAAELAGMAYSEWCALESGWVPDDLPVLHAVAETLQTCYLRVSFWVEVSQYNQEMLAAQGNLA